jgi:hypothetical protein
MMDYPENLLARQNADGGWSYFRGGSWTEPTCYAMLALAASGARHERELRRGMDWLRRCQRADGGFAPRESVPESTWLTALTLLLPAGLEGIDRDKAGTWTIEQTGRESGWVNRLRLWMLGAEPGDTFKFDGWAWYPGTAAWIGPTAISVLALEKLEKAKRGADGASLKKRIDQGRGFLLSRHCRDGGWNHGSTSALGYDSDSYPETTGLALLALHGENGPEVSKGVERGEQHLTMCRSSEAVSWLRIGLSAHGRIAAATPGGSPNGSVDATVSPAMHGGVMEIALAALADAAQAGTNLLLPV